MEPGECLESMDSDRLNWADVLDFRSTVSCNVNQMIQAYQLVVKDFFVVAAGISLKMLKKMRLCVYPK